MSAMERFPDCLLCQGAHGDPDLHRAEVWSDDRWRLTTSLAAEIPGFSYLEPRRHISDITELDGEEATSLGPVLALATSALKGATGCDLVYLYVFGGGIPHLHIHLAPHLPNDALNDQIIRGAVRSERLPSGAELVTSLEFPPLPEETLRAIAQEIRERLAV
jgi:diadenosine tetraphosphate (Ap4A) HIT family hydrolase